jgi:RNA polymerase sigma-70 factor (ECF subfamily)
VGELPPDEQLLARLTAGDEACFVLLVDAWSPGMLRVARAFVSTPDSAAEVVQDAWVGVIEGLGGFAGRSSLRTWVFRILVNTAKRRGVRESRVVPWSSVAPDAGPTVDPALFQRAGEPFPGHWRVTPAPWPEQQALAAEVRAFLTEAITRLPERQRVVLVLRDVAGHDADEVCRILDLTPANQRVLLHRARATIRRELAAYHEEVPT